MSEAVPLELLSLSRPRKRSQCEGGMRPCPWVSCRHHLGIDVSRRGTLLENHRLLDHTGDRPLPSCSLDVADAVAGHHRADVRAIVGAMASAMGISTTRVVQLVKDTQVVFNRLDARNGFELQELFHSRYG